MLIFLCLNISLEFNFTCSGTLELNCTNSQIQMRAKFSKVSGIYLSSWLQNVQVLKLHGSSVMSSKANLSSVLLSWRQIFTKIQSYFSRPRRLHCSASTIRQQPYIMYHTHCEKQKCLRNEFPTKVVGWRLERWPLNFPG